MRNYLKVAITSISTVVAAGVLGLAVTQTAVAEGGDAVAEGKKVAENRKKGNCLSCHMMGMAGGNMPGTVGPPLIAMKQRFTREALYSQIAEPRLKNVNSIMPPFGAHGILTDKELDAVVEYVHTL